jgi:peptide/nickel transport system permease protein
MTQYAIRRILYSIPVIFGILLVTFVMARSIPGDPCKAMLGEKATAEVCERFTREHGLDQPIPVQFGIYMRDMLSGDFGDSIRSRPIYFATDMKFVSSVKAVKTVPAFISAFLPGISRPIPMM